MNFPAKYDKKISPELHGVAVIWYKLTDYYKCCYITANGLGKSCLIANGREIPDAIEQSSKTSLD